MSTSSEEPDNPIISWAGAATAREGFAVFAALDLDMLALGQAALGGGMDRCLTFACRSCTPASLKMLSSTVAEAAMMSSGMRGMFGVDVVALLEATNAPQRRSCEGYSSVR